MIKKIMLILFGQRCKGEAVNDVVNFNSTYPIESLTFNEWVQYIFKNDKHQN